MEKITSRDSDNKNNSKQNNSDNLNINVNIDDVDNRDNKNFDSNLFENFTEINHIIKKLKVVEKESMC